jgi:hypothetical protein
VTPAPHSSVADATLGTEVVVFDERTALVYRLNPSASVIWSLFDGMRTVEEIATELTSTVGADLTTIREQILHAVNEFERRGLVVAGSDD